MVKSIGLALIAAVLIWGCRTAKQETQEAARTWTYPETQKVDQVDDYFGTRVPDPYRWLEDDQAPEVANWVKAQNALTFSYLESIPFREAMIQNLESVYSFPRYGVPRMIGDRVVFTRNSGLQNQSVIYIQDGLGGEPRVLIDPNQLSPDGTVRIRLLNASSDQRYVAISQSKAGSDWQEIRVMDLTTDEETSDRIQWVKFSDVVWHEGGFFYSCYEKPAEGDELKAVNANQRVYYHKLGTGQDEDRLVFEDPEHPLRYHSVSEVNDGSHLVLASTEGTHGQALQVLDLRQKEWTFQPLIKTLDYENAVVDHTEKGFLVHTTIDAPMGRLVCIDPNHVQQENWTEIIPENPDEAIQGLTSAGGYLFVRTMRDASSRVRQYDMAGKLVRDIALPGLGSAEGFDGSGDQDVLFYGFESFTNPGIVYQFDVASGESKAFFDSELPFNPEDYVTRQVFFASKDGTRVPMFLVHRKGMEFKGDTPTLLYAYGGFNISMLPYFRAHRIALLDSGALFALANLRGGGEYGEAWHQAGMLQNKQNVFDDFIAAAEYLIQEKYTSKDRLAIAGGSNGGLLVGACMTQRPDLFKVALPAVGVMDMLRYHKFTVGWGWAVEYGSSDNKEDFHNLFAYSPLHNIKPGAHYPATMVTTADHDDRVVPAHSFKFIAALQAAQAGDNPVIIRIETQSGHGSSNTRKQIEEVADEYSFMFENMGVTPQFIR